MIRFPRRLIPRKHYIDMIKPFMRKNIIKVLSGQRRVGKSYILFQIMQLILQEEPDANIIYLNLEDFENIDIKTDRDLNEAIKRQLHKDQKNYIFIDEIQDIDGFERVIRSLVLNENNDIYITGSNSHMLSSELSTYLSGRYIEFKILSLAYPEFLEFHKLESSPSAVEKFQKFGGLPYLCNIKLDEETVSEYLKSIYSTILFRDIVDRYNIRNINFLERLTEFLAENIGNMFSAKKISDFLKSQQIKIGVTQIQNYLEFLSNAFLIHRVARYDITGKRFFEIGEKYYFDNLGLRNTIIGYRVSDEGKLLENLVYNHLLYKGYKVYIGYKGSKEIDFIAERNNEKIYIQVALKLDNEETIEREFGNLLTIDDNYPKFVITRDSFSGNTYKGIPQMSILQFLES